MSALTASPRDRLLETARRLFYAEGIHAVGVDRLVTEAGVTRAIFYRHFPTKEALHDGALAAAQLDDPAAVRRAVTNAALQLLQPATKPADC